MGGVLGRLPDMPQVARHADERACLCLGCNRLGRLLLVTHEERPSIADDASPSNCPACGAPPEQSTEPMNMSRSVCYCGHPRFYDYKHLVGKCPCQQATGRAP